MAGTNELDAQQTTLRIPIYSEDKYRSTGDNLDQLYINCYPEIIRDSSTGEGSTFLQKRSPIGLAGLDLFATTGAAAKTDLAPMANICITQLDDVYICAIGNRTTNTIYILQYRPIAGTILLLGTIPATTSVLDFIHITECQIASSGVKAGFVIVYTKKDRTASKCYYAVSDGTVFTGTPLTQITNAAFPDQQTPALVCTGPMQQMNGIFYAMTTDGRVWNSGSTAGTPNDPTSWNTLSVLLTYQYPDGGIGIYRYKHHLMAFGTDSIEFLNDIGNPPPASRLERTEQAFIKFGAIHSMGILNVDDTMYWLAYGSTDVAGLWKLEGYTPVKISTAKQDQLIGRAVSGITASELSLFSILFNQKKHIGINLVTFTTQWNSSALGQYGLTTDTNYANQGLSNIRASCLMYSLEDKIWWGMAYQQDWAVKYFPCTSYPGASAQSNSFYTQYMLIAYASGASPVTISPSRVFQIGTPSAGGYIDRSPDGSRDDSQPIAIHIQFNQAEFDNIKRKRISKLSLVWANTPMPISSDTGLYSINLFYNKLNYSVTGGATLYYRSIAYPNTSARHYFNNLGMSRYFVFGITAMTKDAFPLKALELLVAQGSH